jgi:hypothetical protein
VFVWEWHGTNGPQHTLLQLYSFTCSQTSEHLLDTNYTMLNKLSIVSPLCPLDSVFME